MDYTAEQMAKMIVLAETLLRYRAITPVENKPMMTLDFHTFDEVSTFELALDEAVISLRGEQSFAETLAARPGFVPVNVKINLPQRKRANRSE
jgi:hypothetical protein